MHSKNYGAEQLRPQSLFSMAPTKYLLLSAILALLSVCRVQSAEQSSFAVNRLIQFSQASAMHGSQKAAVNMYGVPFGARSSYQGYMVVVNIGSISLIQIKELVSDKKPGSILFIIPQEELDRSKMEEWISIEDWLVSQAELKIPVWFALENHQTEALYGTLQSMQDQTTLVVESPEPKEIKKPEISNIQGLLTGLTIGESASHDNRETNSGDITSIPTIAITAYWDSFSSAPGLAYGANSGATGSIALFHIARVLSKLYSNARTQARYNVVFLLSSGSHLNYAGTRHWIDSSATGSAVRESLAWVLCLDGIGLDGELILHASRPAKDPNAARIYNTFTNVAERNQIPFSISHRKINIAEASSSWEHEVFARRKILAVTLSQHSKPAERVGIFDRKRNINLETFTRNLMFVTEVVTRLLYHQDDSDPTIIATANATLTSNWLDSLSAIPRMVPYVDAQHPILDYLEHNLKQFAPDVSRQNFKPDSEKVFYTALSATLTSYRTQPFTFDLSILVAVLVFNAAIYTGLKGDIAAAIADFASLLVWVKGKFSSAAAPTTEGKKSKRN